MWTLISVGRDITERKRLEAELRRLATAIEQAAEMVVITDERAEIVYLEAQKMEAIGTLAGGIAHDFNNILAIILTNTQILEFSGAIGGESKETLNQIIIASKRARELVRQILAISRRGKQEKIIMNLKPIVKETIGLPARVLAIHEHSVARSGRRFRGGPIRYPFKVGAVSDSDPKGLAGQVRKEALAFLAVALRKRSVWQKMECVAEDG
jgi:signal transduction histidine kinase